MLKAAFYLGVKLAYDDEGLTPEQMLAAQRLSGIGGGIAGATSGSLLGKSLGEEAAKRFGQKGWFGGTNKKTVEHGRLAGGILGALGGGGLGAYAGTQLPRYLKKEVGASPQPTADQSEAENSLGLLPRIIGSTPDQRMNASLNMRGFYPEY